MNFDTSVTNANKYNNNNNNFSSVNSDFVPTDDFLQKIKEQQVIQ